MECPYCNAVNRDGVRFCNNCGKPLPLVPVSTAGQPAAATDTTGATSRSLTPGSRLQGGRYIIKKILGQGGMGAALLATDIRLDSKPVVIKELISDNTDPAKLQEDVRNFKREVATLAHLDHPLITNVTDHFQEGSRYFMVQEYIEGENLEERMDRVNQPMKEREALGYASEVLDILDYLSQETPPIVHRDIKPANIIVGTKDKRAHLVDFGIARADVVRNVQRKQTSALGTPGYAPPEQYQGNADPRSDLYALAATLHHLLTNRDPRDHPPFTYPPARTLNPQLSPEIEKVLSRALINEINQRYQSAAAMKKDIDDILLKRFGVSGNVSSYTLGTSGPIGAAGAASAANAPTVPYQPARIQPSSPSSPPTPPPAVPYPPPQVGQGNWQNIPPYAPVSVGSRPPQQPQRKSNTRRNLLLVVLLIGAAFFAIPYFSTHPFGQSSNPGSGGTATVLPSSPLNHISYGAFAFDTNRADGHLKLEAAAALKAGDTRAAHAYWNLAIAEDGTDAEAHIYRENQSVLDSGNSYITFIVVTALTGNPHAISVGRDTLQGAYVAQKEYNDNHTLPGNLQVRLLIANIGDPSPDIMTVAQQIVQAKRADTKIVGVMGWPFGSDSNAIKYLSASGIPMVSLAASSDALPGISPYFFSVTPSIKNEAIAGAMYAEHTWHATKAALFYDPTDPYSSNLAEDFRQQFEADGNIILRNAYAVGHPEALHDLLHATMSGNSDLKLIYFAGYPEDARVLLQDVHRFWPQVQVMGGDALYQLVHTPNEERQDFDGLYFTAFAYPDEWKGQVPESPFFNDYKEAFDPQGRHPGNPYSYNRTNNTVMLSYDAMLALLRASSMALAMAKSSLTPEKLQQALAKIRGSQSLQGVSGQISFGQDGAPQEKAVVVLYVAPRGIQLIRIQEGRYR